MLTKKPWRLGTRAKLLMRGLRYSCILPYTSINGWLSVDEAITLFELAKGLPDSAPRAVEIGSWQGKSTVCIAQGLRDKPGAQLTCIDPFDASGDDESRGAYDGRAQDLKGPLRSAFEENLAAASVRAPVDGRAGCGPDGRCRRQIQRSRQAENLRSADARAGRAGPGRRPWRR